MKFIALIGKLGKGKFAIVDNEEFEALNKFKWRAIKFHNTLYVIRTSYDKKIKNTRTVFMHRQIMKVKNPKIHIDHKRGNGLDNRKNFLRVATCSQNLMNRGKQINSRNKYKGVFKNTNCSTWVMSITYRGNKIVKYFKTEIEAAKSYNFYAKKYHKQFAKLNKI